MTEQPRTPLLQQRQFRMLTFTRFSSRLAQNALNFGLVLLIINETGSSFTSSLLVLALVVPSTVAGIAAGAAADVFPKRLLIVAGDLARAAICIVFVRASEGVAQYYVVAVVLSAATQFATTAEGAVMPAIVERSELARANAIGQAVGGAAQVLGFGVLTPVMLRLFGNGDPLFMVAAALFALAAFQAVGIGRLRSLSRAEIGARYPEETEGTWWKVGWRVMRANPSVMRAAIELTLISTALIVLGGLIPKYIKETLGLPVDVGALILMPAAIGVVLGLRTAGFLAHRVSHAVLSTFGFVTFVILLALVAFVNQEAEFLGGYGLFAWLNDIEIGSFDGGGAMAMILVLPLGFAYAIVTVAAQTVINDLVPLHLQGRVNSTQAALSALAASLPVLAFGAIGDWVGVTPAVALLAALIGAGAVANRGRRSGKAPALVGGQR
ncbi:MAG: MFS transporter [Thermoflexaceae bacterium]|nr:MFS transporter [Thermoflexaceae bacterium]